jgi:N utilization substance protein B
MGARSKARKRALDVLYASEMRGESPTEALDRAIADGEGPTNDYTATLVRGVVERQAEIDELLATYSESWTLDRMPAVDRNVLRLGVWEMLYAEDVPDTVAVSEAMALVRELSTDESPPFVNGILGAIQRRSTA